MIGCRVMNKTDSHREYVKKNKELINSIERKYYYAHRESILMKAKEYYQTHKEELKRRAAEYCKQNRDKVREKVRRYETMNPTKIREYRRTSDKKRRANPSYRLHKNVSRVINYLLASGKDRRSTEELLGYSIAKLRAHLEKQFQPGMTWENYGEWHTDHKIPISAFNFETPDDIDFKRCWALKNLQPLWKRENIVKGGKVKKPFQPSLVITECGR